MRRTSTTPPSSSTVVRSDASIVATKGQPLETLAVAVAAGVLSTIGGPAPTGQTAVDAFLVGLLVTFVSWFGAAVPVRVAGAATLIAGSLAVSWPGVAIGAVAYVVSARRVGRRTSKIVSAVLCGLALNLAARSDLRLFLGASTIVAVLVAAAIVAVAATLQPRPMRRAALGVGLVVVAGPILATAAFALPAINSRDDLRAGERLARDGLDLLADGDLDNATASFEQAAVVFSRVEDRVTGPLAMPASLVPVVAQHRRAVGDVAAQSTSSLEALATELAKIDLDRLSVSDGRINVEAVRALEEPLVEIQESVGGLGDTLDAVDSQWLAPALRDRLSTLGIDIDAELLRSGEIISVVRQVPALLGGEGQRVYFVGFTTPAEARGLGGFMGNWAEITVQNGSIEMTGFGRSDDLDDDARPGERTVTGPDDWLARYGQFGFTSGPGNRVGTDPWKNITVSPSMSSTGQVIAELYPQSGGRPINGVFVLDVFAVARLLEFTGPIELPDGEGNITAETAPDFLLNEQYRLTDTAQRADVLEIVSSQVFDELLSTDLPPPSELVDMLGPLVDEGRLSAYATDVQEQELLEQIGLAGTLVEPDGRDAFAIVMNNSIGNKIDFFLESSASYSVVADRDQNTVDATLDVVLENRAPAFGQPKYVIGNPLGYPDGTNRTYLSVFSRLPVQQTDVDGATVVTSQEIEKGYFVTSLLVELAPKQSRTVSFDMSGSLDLTNGYDLVLRSPPTARPMKIDVSASLTGGGRSDQSDMFTSRRAGSYTASLGAPTEGS